MWDRGILSMSQKMDCEKKYCLLGIGQCSFGIGQYSILLERGMQRRDGVVGEEADVQGQL